MGMNSAVESCSSFCLLLEFTRYMKLTTRIGNQDESPATRLVGIGTAHSPRPAAEVGSRDGQG